MTFGNPTTTTTTRSERRSDRAKTGKARKKKAASKKKTAPKSDGKKDGAEVKPAIDLPVEFGTLSIGDGTTRLGVKISRTKMSLSAADKSLCGRRLTGKVMLIPGTDDPDQTYLVDDMGKHEVESVFDVKRFSVGPEYIGCGLTFARLEIDCNELALFAKKQGRLVVDVIDEIPAPRKDDEDDDE